MSLTDSDLFNLADSYNIKIVDIVMKDKLEQMYPDPGFYIINLQSSSQGSGTHWVALIITTGVNYYFDSFGASPPNEIRKFISRTISKSFAFNNWIIQDINSELCGWYCLGLFIFINRNLNTKYSLTQLGNEYSNLFLDNTKNNAQILKYFFKYNISNHNNLETTILAKFK